MGHPTATATGRGVKRTAKPSAGEAAAAALMCLSESKSTPPAKEDSAMSDTSSTTSLLPEAAELYNLLQRGEEEDGKPQTQVWLTPPRNGLAGHAHHHQPPSKRLRSHPLGDVELLTSASVLLAACGVMHALQPILDSAHPARRQRVCATLRSECLHVRTLDVPRFARLSHLLMLPLDVGRSWHARVEELLRQMAPSPSSSPLSAPRSAPACAASARSTFHSALPPGIEPRGLIGCFGRQTTWCIVAMLRRVLSETNGLVAGDHCHHPSRADMQLASRAVSLISGQLAQSAASPETPCG